MDDQEFVISETSESQPPIKGFSIKVVDDTFLIQFVDELASELVSLDITQDDIGHMLIMLDSEQIQMLQFPGLADRFDLNKVKIRYSSIKDIFYIANANTSHHDYSVEVEQFDEKIMIDFDVNDQIIGFAILGASTMINPDFLNELPDHVWIPFTNGIEQTVEPVKVPKKRRAKRRKRKKYNKPRKRIITHVVPDKDKNYINTKQFFKRQITRDLDWIINSPSLLSTESDIDVLNPSTEIPTDAIVEKLIQVDDNPDSFYDWIDPWINHCHVLGGYFRILLQFWMEYKYKNSGINLNEDFLIKYQLCLNIHKTLGDLDFVIKDTEKSSWAAWKVGVKFYILSENLKASEITDFYRLSNVRGPLWGKDTLLSYIEKNLSIFELKNLPEVKEQLDNDKVGPFERELLVLKGYIFYPITESWYEGEVETITNCPQVNPNHLYGWWAKWDTGDFLLIENSSVKLEESRWVVLEKCDYMAPVLVNAKDDHYTLVTYDELRATIEVILERKSAVFVSHLVRSDEVYDKEEPNNLVWQELSRGWVINFRERKDDD
eukprot:TRINITY_DN2770_c0_g1_i1.p1 TRINITY_DN2770_c0_g1~~TRINITY_DN2770_c0_g1_i1.p1  ORF type:complete len:548 (+),score=114.82 TRINITY_DN2770_c0_g1_i1:11-1654(+)